MDEKLQVAGHACMPNDGSVGEIQIEAKKLAVIATKEDWMDIARRACRSISSEGRRNFAQFKVSM